MLGAPALVRTHYAAHQVACSSAPPASAGSASTPCVSVEQVDYDIDKARAAAQMMRTLPAFNGLRPNMCKPHGLWFCSGQPGKYVPSNLGGGWFDYCCEFATDHEGAALDASSNWGRRVEWAHELRLDKSKILQLRTEDELLAFVREYGIFVKEENVGEVKFGEAPVERPPWASANAEILDLVKRSSSQPFEKLTPFGSGGMAFFASALDWRRVALDFGGIEIVPYRYDDPWRCGCIVR
jgi:hypothetical protein|tara:strand:+ start:147 stop:863 length:717 start_codon:yes stop_codon:yes gene_type:complete